MLEYSYTQIHSGCLLTSWFVHVTKLAFFACAARSIAVAQAAQAALACLSIGRTKL